MSSDGYFGEDDEFDAAALAQLTAIEAAHFSPTKQGATTISRRPATSPVVPSKPASSKTLAQDMSFDDLSFDFDETDLGQLDTFIADSYQGKAKPVAGPSKMSRTSSSNKVQTTLFGEVLQPVASASSSRPRQQLERTKSAPRNPFGQQARKTKQWDQTQFAKTGIRKAKPTKGKGRMGEDLEEEPELEFEQFPAPFVSIGPPPPMKLSADLLEAKHWIYPLNRPKRDYQFNIVKKSLFDNTLVALPTGLGKTFIAGVVMLNYYRWFPEGKVVFVAPAKPLVAQQITACHETCGIPGSDSIELNGDVPASVRARYWKEKRVFFMTPQTLMNDLSSEICDVRDIVLYVVDEAHRATGDYSYNQVIRFLMAKNPHFRVLALTATPGNNVEAIQALIDSLHISHIEIRNEESLDLKAYIHKKIYKPHVIAPDKNLGQLRDLLVKTMDVLMKPLYSAGLLYPGDSAIKIHPFRPQMLMKSPQAKQFYSALSMLSKLARAMLYLVAGSYKTCYIFCHEIMNDRGDEESQGSKKKPAQGKKLRDDPNFRAFMAEFERQHAQGFTTHPKIDKLKLILIDHFAKKIPEDEGEDDTKVMVFSSFRGVVDEIVEELNKDRPLIRAARFIGQGTDKQGNKGLAQKEQLAVINKLKSGEYNVLVATSIGEEGLDIGELDMTVCYDADKAPTRMIQRFGRTGRKREGIIHALLAEGREEGNIDKAEATYKEVQNVVNRGEMYELYGDVERLLPDHIVPQCVEKVVEIQEYVRPEGRQKAPAKGTKRKRNDDVARNIPDGASTGFVSVRELVVKGTKKQKKKAVLPKNFDTLGENDETDDDIESGRVVAVPRRTQSAAAAQSSEKKGQKGKLKKSATIATNKAPKKRKKKTKEYSASQLSQLAADDSDDIDIEAGVVVPSLRRQLEASRACAKALSPTLTPEASPPERLKTRIDNSVIELSDSDRGHTSSPKREDRYDYPALDSPTLDPTSPNGFSQAEQNMSWLVDDDDDDNHYDFKVVDSSPLAPRRPPPIAFERVQLGDESIEISNPMLYDNDVVPTSDPFEPMAEDSLEIIEPPLPMKEKNKAASQHGLLSPFRPASILLSPSRNKNAPGISRFHPAGTSKNIPSPAWDRSNSPAHLARHKGKTSMLPPALPQRFLASMEDSPDPQMPEASFPVRPLQNQAKRRRVVYDEPESPSAASELDSDMPPPSSQHRLHRMESTPTREKPAKNTKRPRAKPSLLARNVNPLFDGEAAHSGDEVSEGYSEEDEESESDRQFIKNSPATQVSRSYDQSLIYRQSLLTQMPAAGSAPSFGDRVPVRARPFGRIDGPRRGERYLPSSSPPPPDDELDNYHLGSFVVDDDEEISYEL